jgi:hypothetical protein
MELIEDKSMKVDDPSLELIEERSALIEEEGRQEDSMVLDESQLTEDDVPIHHTPSKKRKIIYSDDEEDIPLDIIAPEVSMYADLSRVISSLDRKALILHSKSLYSAMHLLNTHLLIQIKLSRSD